MYTRLKFLPLLVFCIHIENADIVHDVFDSLAQCHDIDGCSCMLVIMDKKNKLLFDFINIRTKQAMRYGGNFYQ